MSTLNLRLDTGDTDVFVQTNSGTITAMNLSRLFKALAGGGHTKPVTLRTDVTPLAAAGTITLVSGSGTITAIINGVSIAITWATDDTVSAALLAAAINASSNALVTGLVTATSALGVCTINAALLGKMGNAVLLSATGTGATASGARLTGGSDGTATSFTF